MDVLIFLGSLFETAALFLVNGSFIVSGDTDQAKSSPEGGTKLFTLVS